MDRRRKRIIAFLQQEGGRAGRGARRRGDDRDPIGRKGRFSFVSPVFVGAAAVVEEFARLPRSREVGMDRGGRRETKWRRGVGGSDPAATVRLLFAEPSISDRCSLVHGALLSLSPLACSLGPLLLLRPFQSLRVDVKIAPSPLELAPMEPIGRPDDELRLREGGEVYR